MGLPTCRIPCWFGCIIWSVTSNLLFFCKLFWVSCHGWCFKTSFFCGQHISLSHFFLRLNSLFNLSFVPATKSCQFKNMSPYVWIKLYNSIQMQVVNYNVDEMAPSKISTLQIYLCFKCFPDILCVLSCSYSLIKLTRRHETNFYPWLGSEQMIKLLLIMAHSHWIQLIFIFVPHLYLQFCLFIRDACIARHE